MSQLSHYAPEEPIKDGSYIITNAKNGMPLSGFYSNSMPGGVLEFSRRNHQFYKSYSDAVEACVRMIGEAELERARWGDEDTDEIISKIKNFKLKPID